MRFFIHLIPTTESAMNAMNWTTVLTSPTQLPSTCQRAPTKNSSQYDKALLSSTQVPRTRNIVHEFTVSHRRRRRQRPFRMLILWLDFEQLRLWVMTDLIWSLIHRTERSWPACILQRQIESFRWTNRSSYARLHFFRIPSLPLPCIYIRPFLRLTPCQFIYCSSFNLANVANILDNVFRAIASLRSMWVTHRNCAAD